MNTKAKCVECERSFDLRNEAEADEWVNGHDCEDTSNNHAWSDGWDECCTDCAIVIVNDDTSGIDSEERVNEVYEGIKRYKMSAQRSSLIVEGDAGFSMRSCSVCRSHLGGDRMYVKAI